MYSTENYIPDPFALAAPSFQYIVQSVSSTQFAEQVRRPQRDSVHKAFHEMDVISQTQDQPFINSLEELGKLQLSPVNQNTFIENFRTLFESEKFAPLRKIIESIPENQRKPFLTELYMRIQGKLAEIRTYNQNALGLSIDKTQIRKILIFDQSILELSILTSKIIEELKKQNSSHLDSLGISFIVLTMKTFAFLSHKIPEDELLKTIAANPLPISTEEKKRFKNYWLALTSV